MSLDVVAYADFKRFRNNHTGYAQKLEGDQFREWRETRRKLIKTISRYGKEAPTARVRGDFFVGEDWFLNRCLYIVALTWTLVSKQLLNGLQGFVREQASNYLVFLGKEVTLDGPDFELAVASDRIIVSSFEKSGSDVRSIFSANSQLGVLIEG